jgi:hypothetical protein
MTNMQRATSATNTNNLVWNGQQVNFQGPLFLAAAGEVVIPYAPGSLD